MVNHVWGLLVHPSQEMKQIKSESESMTHFYSHHVLLMAAIPVICAYIGTTRIGWTFSEGLAVKLSPMTALFSAIIFYLLILGAVALMGQVIHWMARRYDSRPSWQSCTLFAGYAATPMFLSGIVAVYPLLWLCLLAGIIGLCYAAYLMYIGIPTFLNIERSEGFIFSSSTLAIGVLVLELLLGLTVVLWGYGIWFS
ncbi:Yip1 family protein [Yersinia ruckeri]|uniref:Membrane protein n=1 Tax=Yersinia ruckeri TaxID=29486 RepID=A0A085U7T4_YERRU|nr:Yip1 family protein [Yersinia ruckeri]ARZ00946.1 Inner membrane protein YohC [Yersinia ruckeri]AUQ43032.1 YIP1 family protein [Yersinia ruckeri]EEQ00518.1 Inner membrane protein yohC [Yersinia ruckeri ATCC 29473]EKN3360873.1 YIP1 family protein [Yersinia ruckeri]EKN4181278.1 YIP1 family protein [Yersinia ruckeri]